MDSVRVIVEPGTGYELLLSGMIVAARQAGRSLDDAAVWRQRAEAAGPDVFEGLRRIGREPFINLLGFVHALTGEPTADAALAALADAPEREVVLALVGYHRRAMRLVTSPAVIRAAVDGDEDARREFRRTSFPDLRYWQASLRYLLSAPAADVRAEVVATFKAWYDRGFADHEAAIGVAIEADGAAVRGLVAAMELDAVLERIAPGIQFAREVGQSLVVLVPDVVLRPGYVIGDHGPTLLIAYPAGACAVDPAAPPDPLVRLGKALGDPLRLRALRELRDGPLTLTDLAQRLGVPRTSLQHHVRILMYAGLVSLSVDDAQWGRLELRDEALAQVSRLAERYVLG
jgi:DNA-binding transcriptional ArsR family regulator